MYFSDSALAKLLQTAPALGPLVVNFQDVSDELGENALCKVGIFVLRSGQDIMYAPVVAKGDDVFPIDSLFLASTGKFVPLTKNTIDSIVASGNISQGKPVKMPPTVSVNPSVYHLINPPRTGKYVYASASRIEGFLSSLPAHVKKATFEKLAGERSLFENLEKMFGLKTIFDALQVNQSSASSSLAAKTNQEPISVITTPQKGLGQDAIQNILTDGYHVAGQHSTKRIAVAAQDFNNTGTVREISSVDADRDYDVCFTSSAPREAFIPKMHRLNGAATTLAIFTDGSYAQASKLVTIGDALDRQRVLDRVFEYCPPVMVKELCYNDTFVLMTIDGEFLGPFTATNCVLNGFGVEVSVTSSRGISKICAYRNFGGRADLNVSDLYVPSNTVVIKLGRDLSCDVERSVVHALKREEVNRIQLLGSELNLGFDGVEYFANGKVVGDVPQTMRLLVVEEGVEPDLARSFIKQAQERRHVRIYMSKQASSTDYNPAEVPQYGVLAQYPDNVGLNGAFIPAVREASELGDSQIVEATVISELLQVPDIFQQISEYLPDIDEAVDKLGRTLFMSRIHTDRLAQSLDSDSVFSLLAQLKNVYRLLGDNAIKLHRLVVGADSMAREQREE